MGFSFYWVLVISSRTQVYLIKCDTEANIISAVGYLVAVTVRGWKASAAEVVTATSTNARTASTSLGQSDRAHFAIY